MSLSEIQLSLLHQASRKLTRVDLAPYVRLRWLLPVKTDEARAEFRKVFAQFYRLGGAGLTEAWKDRYFQLLFDFKPGEVDPHARLLRDLYKYPRAKGDQALEFSFVSKLVATHDESQPIYDSHVRAFFGLEPVGPGPVKERIQEFRGIVATVRKSYAGWVADPRFPPLLKTLVDTEPELAHSHPRRLCDMLVWTVGGKHLTAGAKGNQV